MSQLEIVTIAPKFDRYGINRDAELRELAHDEPLPGYPEMSDRWRISTKKWDDMDETGVITVPDGPWNITNHPDREGMRTEELELADEHTVDPRQTAKWRAEGLLVSDRGFPIHPLGRLGVTGTLENGTLPIGMATGLGRHLQPGPIAIGNLAVSRGDEDDLEYAVVSTPRRTKNGVKYRLSFPGGYAKPGETVEEACLREGDEEANLGVIAEITGNPLGSIVRRIVKLSPSLGGPNTLNAWLDEHFAFAEAPNSHAIRSLQLQTSDPREVSSVLWVSEARLVDNPNFMGAHRRALQDHIAWRQRQEHETEL